MIFMVRTILQLYSNLDSLYEKHFFIIRLGIKYLCVISRSVVGNVCQYFSTSAKHADVFLNRWYFIQNLSLLAPTKNTDATILWCLLLLVNVKTWVSRGRNEEILKRLRHKFKLSNVCYVRIFSVFFFVYVC